MSDDLIRLQGTPTPGEIAGRNTDPRFFAAISILPNPDPILRRSGRSEDVFSAIQSDAHVIGELRSIQADLLRYTHTLTSGGDKRVDRRAFDLCQGFLDRSPAPYTAWPDVFWNIAQSTFRGLSVQEIVWEKQGDLFLPERILDRPKRRFHFNGFGELRVLTRDDPLFGLPAEELYFLVDRHMASYDQPYGISLFSSCFWPYTFKHAGFRWFVKFCERFGIPFPVGKYPVGASKETIDALEAALENLVEAGYAALEDGSDIELKEVGISGRSQLQQKVLIDTCNAEMSKALTSQTLATEQTGQGGGSRAASQTHAERGGNVNQGIIQRVARTLDHLWALITRVNLGPDAVPPTSDFVGDNEATTDRANVYKIFIDAGGAPSRKAMAEDLGITLANPKDPNDALHAPAPVPPLPGTGVQFSAADQFPDQTALDAAIDAIGNEDQSTLMAPILQPVLEMARRDPTTLLATLGEAYPKMDPARLVDTMTRLLFVADTWGRLIANQEADDAGNA